jgi:creatinine amidohydrolase
MWFMGAACSLELTSSKLKVGQQDVSFCERRLSAAVMVKGDFMAAKVRTAEMSWKEVEAARDRGAVVIIPMGSTEEHGPHSPTGDYLITDEIAARVASATNSVMIPTLPFSYSEYFRHYPGTITLQRETLRLLVHDAVTSLLDQGFARIVLFNGHKGNEPVLQLLARELRRDRQTLVPIVAPLAFGLTRDIQQELYGDIPTGHGGEPIGSIMTYLHGDLMNMDLAGEWGAKEFLGLKPAGLNGVHFEGRQVGMAINMEDVTPATGSMSDPRGASSEKGERIVTNSVEGLTHFIEWFKSVDPKVAP